MGALGQTLLKTLGIQAGVPGAVDSPVGVVPPENGGYNDMTEGVMGFPSVARGRFGGGPNANGSMSLGGDMPDAPPGYDGPNFMGDPGDVPPAPPGFDEAASQAPAGPSLYGGAQQTPQLPAPHEFKAKRPSFWGLLGDQLLKHWGAEPHFAKDKEQKNLRHAMDGFTTDPLAAIERIAKIPGYEAKAWDLMDKYEDNRRAAEATGSLVDNRKEQIMNRALQVFGGVKDDGSNWPAVRATYLAIAKRNGFGDVYLPEEYDKDFITAQIASGMKLTDQDNSEYKRANLERMNRDTTSNIEHRQNIDNQAATNEAGRDTRSAIVEAGKDRRDLTPPQKPIAPKGSFLQIKDSKGIIRNLEVDPTGQEALAKIPGGMARYRKQGNNWVVVETRMAK